jgi:hypothetical protein
MTPASSYLHHMPSKQASKRVSTPRRAQPQPSPWPHRLLHTATPAQARRLADSLVAQFGSDPYAWAKPGGFKIEDECLAALNGDIEALCIPMERNRFLLWIDSAHPADQKCAPDAATLAARKLFRLCHEIGHSFFYARITGRRPYHISSDFDGEERFCDAFARRLTGLREPPARLKQTA